MLLDRETLHELDAPHKRIKNPFGVGLRLSGVAVIVFAVAAAARLARFSLPEWDLDWTWIAAVTTVIVASSFAYAYLGARYGRRIARRIVGGVLAIVLLVGLYALTRYTNAT
jgi:uncharacterized membrane protein YfcA